MITTQTFGAIQKTFKNHRAGVCAVTAALETLSPESHRPKEL